MACLIQGSATHRWARLQLEWLSPELRALSLMPAPPEAAQNLRGQKITQLSPAISQSLSKDSSK